MRALLALPILCVAALASAHEPPADALLATLPFLDHPEPHRVVVDLAPEGSRPLIFMVDTGATHNVATPRAAKELGLRIRRLKSDPYRRRTLLGRDVQIIVDVRTSDTASRTGWEYALLGGQFLAEYVVEFDFAARHMRLFDRKRYEVPERVEVKDEAVLPLTVRGNRPGLEIGIQGKPTLVMLDTGAQSPLIVSGEIADAAGLEAMNAGSFESRGVMGAMVTELRMAEKLRLGPFEWAGVPTVVLPHGWFNQVMPGGSVIGYELLAQFKVRIDYSRRRLWLKRNPNAKLTFHGHEFDDLLAKLDAEEPAD